MSGGDGALNSATRLGDSTRLNKHAISRENARKIQRKLQAALYGSTAAKFFAKYGRVYSTYRQTVMSGSTAAKLFQSMEVCDDIAAVSTRAF